MTVTIWSWSTMCVFPTPWYVSQPTPVVCSSFCSLTSFQLQSFFSWGSSLTPGVLREVQGLKDKPSLKWLLCTLFCKNLSPHHLFSEKVVNALSPIFSLSTISWLSLPHRLNAANLDCVSSPPTTIVIFSSLVPFMFHWTPSRSALGDEEERESDCDICQISTMPPSRICHTAPRAFVWLTWEPFSPLPWLPTLSALQQPHISIFSTKGSH